MAESKEERQAQLAMVLTHKFLVPQKIGKSDPELLKQAVALARRDDLQEKRAQFYKWQEDIIEQDITDTKAIEEMEAYLKQYNEVVRKAAKEVYWKYGFMVLNVTLGMLGANFGEPISTATGLVNVLSFAKQDRKPRIEAGDCQAAAMFHDIRNDFEWK
jgi:hypothetical protein